MKLGQFNRTYGGVTTNYYEQSLSMYVYINLSKSIYWGAQRLHSSEYALSPNTQRPRHTKRPLGSQRHDRRYYS
jgi:hypothetical protein